MPDNEELGASFSLTGSQPASSLTQNDTIQLGLALDTEEAKDNVYELDAIVEMVKEKFSKLRQRWITWYRAISRNVNMVLTLLSRVMDVSVAQQVMQGISTGVTMTALMVRAKVEYAAAAAGEWWRAILGHFLVSQTILLGVVQAQAFQGAAQAKQLASDIQRIQTWSDSVF